MSDQERLRQLGVDLAMLLDQAERGPALRRFDDPAGDALAALGMLVKRLHAKESRREALIRDRSFQLELVLDILRSRDREAAEQAEWDFATDLQLSGLPQDFPPYPDRSDFDIYAGMVTAKEVGGDLYDFFLLAPDRLGFVVADAAGKGLPAAIFITLTRTLLRAAAQKQSLPGDCLSTVNAMLCIDNPTLMFTTAFYGILDTTTGDILFANAGHNPPYVARNDGSVDALCGTGGMALGIMDDMRYETQHCRLAPGEVLVCFSDGVTEATNADGALFGDDRLIGLVTGQAQCHPTEVFTSVIADVDSYMALAPMADDVTLLVIRYNGLRDA
ncbi:MAG: PP2C family protein-serine/threonine phosphatase [Methylovirgula sp.]